MAQRGVNKVILIGKLGQDPEIKEIKNGKMAIISIATSETWKDKDSGEQKEKTEWHRVTAFGPVVNILEQYAKKGTQLYVEAQLATRKWQDENGKDQYNLDIVVQGFDGKIQLLHSPQKAEDGESKSPKTPDAPAQKPSQPSPQPSQQSAPPIGEDEDDDIPF